MFRTDEPNVEITVSGPAKVAKTKVQDKELDALETKLASLKTRYLSGNVPGKSDREMFEKVGNKSLIGYPLSAGWYSTISMFQPGVREAW